MNKKLKRFLLLSLATCSMYSAAQAQLNALNFDGANDFAEGTNASLPQGNSPRTIECWVRKPSSASGSIVNWGTRSANQRFGLISIGASMYIVGEVNDYNTGVSISDNLWHHVAVTFDGTSIRCYKNGVQIGNTTAKFYNTTGSTIRLGQRVGPNASTEYLNGSVDEVRLWNRALCIEELRANMNGKLPNPATQPGLVAYYTMDQGTADGSNTGLTTLMDESTSASNLTLNNFALSGTTSNYVSGATAITGTNPANLLAVAASSQSITQSISGTSATDIKSCGALMTITPTGGGYCVKRQCSV